MRRAAASVLAAASGDSDRFGDRFTIERRLQKLAVRTKRSCVNRAGGLGLGGQTSGMSVKNTGMSERQAARWARRLMEDVRAVLAQHPEADPDTVRHTLILLQKPPLERLARSLIRGRPLAQPK